MFHAVLVICRLEAMLNRTLAFILIVPLAMACHTPPKSTEVSATVPDLSKYDLKLTLSLIDSTDHLGFQSPIASSTSSNAFHFASTESTQIAFHVYDVKGKALKIDPDTMYQLPGIYNVTLRSADTLADAVQDGINSGVYFLRIRADDSSFVRKFVILR